MTEFDEDYRRYVSNRQNKFRRMLSILNDSTLRAIWYSRNAQIINHSIIKSFFRSRSRKLFRKNLNEITLDNIGGGILLNHPYNIVINSRARIGKNFTIFKGATIGSIRSGDKKGTPTIGDRVTVCCNAFVCGNINVGDDVLIAANAYVNFDVPSNSIVIGNPGVIHQKNNPSADYLDYLING